MLGIQGCIGKKNIPPSCKLILVGVQTPIGLYQLVVSVRAMSVGIGSLKKKARKGALRKLHFRKDLKEARKPVHGRI